jgi:hypothetical protein
MKVIGVMHSITKQSCIQLSRLCVYSITHSKATKRPPAQSTIKCSLQLRPAVVRGAVEDIVVLFRTRVVFGEAIGGLQVQHHLPGLEGLGGLLQGVVEVVDVVHAEEREQPLVADHAGDVVDHLGSLLVGVRGVPVGNPEAPELELLLHEQVMRQRQRLLGHTTVGNKRPSGSQCARQVRRGVAADAVQGELDRRQVAQDLAASGGAQIGIQDVHVPAEVGKQLQLDLHVGPVHQRSVQ